MSALIQSFSGTHPFRPRCLLGAMVDGDSELAEVPFDQAGQRLARLETRQAHRRRTLPTVQRTVRTLTFPAGSRLTPRWCIPLCFKCGSHEALPVDRNTLAGARAWRCGAVDEWPVEREQILDDLARFDEEHGSTTAIIDGDTLISEGCVDPINLIPTTGGWAQYGYDDTYDRTEREWRGL